MSSKSSRNPSPEEKKGRTNRKPRTEEFHPEEEKSASGGGVRKGKAEVKTEERKETQTEQTSDQTVPPPSAPRSKGYRANRVAKSKKKDTEVDKNEKPEELQQKKPLDESKIPPLTSAPNVITLDNDKID